MPEISFLIPALNEEHNIGNCIRAIREHAGALPAWEVVVGDHGSTDATAAVASGLGAKVVALKGGTIAALRNFLIANSGGWLIVFVDADVCITPEWGAAIASTVADLRREPRQITGSRCSAPDSDNRIIRHWFAVMPTENRTYLGTGHIIFTRQGAQEIGGFDASLRTGEDYDFCMRAVRKGYAMNINAKLHVIHYDYPLSVGAFMRREQWHGSGDFQSLSNILHSKIALLTLAFIGLHVAALCLLAIDVRWVGLCVCLIAFMMISVSVWRFPGLGTIARANNILLFYVYLVGRSRSFFAQLPTLLRGQQETRRDVS